MRQTRTKQRSPPRRGRRTAAVAALAALAFSLPGDPHADNVISSVIGDFGGSNPSEALGPPNGGGMFVGSVEAHTLGVGGSVTLEFANPCVDGPGTDLIVQENSFLLLGDGSRAFCETAIVEVSSNNVHWAQFPTVYLGPPVQSGPFDGVEPNWYVGFTGVLPVSAGATLGVDPLDVVNGGGDAFDLADLDDHPLVDAGLLSLGSVRYVRITDVDSGNTLDDNGTLVFDAGLDGSASADIDAVTAVNHTLNQSFDRPRVEMTLDDAGFLTIELADPNGIADIKTGLTASVNGIPIDFFQLLPFFLITNATPFSATLVTGPVPPGFAQVILRVGAVDNAGLVGGDSLHLY